MNRPRLQDFRAQWPAETMGICVTDPAVTRFCNESQERLIMDPLAPDEGWVGGWLTLALTASVVNGSAYVTTPREIARLIVMGVCQEPVHIRNGFYEYLNFGKGLLPKTCQATGCGQTFQAVERDNVFTLGTLLSTPQTLRVYPSDTRDTGLRVLIQGKDQNGMVVLTTDPGTGLSASGEYIAMNFPFTDSTYQYSSISGVMKDETYGPVSIFQVDPSTGVELPLTTLEPMEGTALYRRYLINGIPSTNLCCTGVGTVQIQAQGRLDFVPVVNEVDYLTIPNVPALIQESMSIRFERMDSQNAAAQANIHHTKALMLLVGQLDLHFGKTNTAVKVPIWGSQPMSRQPV